MDKIHEVRIDDLLHLLSTKGGTIVSTANLAVNEIKQARASKRMYVNEFSLGFVWMPEFTSFPKTIDEVKEFENWYPLDEELPESIKEWNPNGDIKE